MQVGDGARIQDWCSECGQGHWRPREWGLVVAHSGAQDPGLEHQQTVSPGDWGSGHAGRCSRGLWGRRGAVGEPGCCRIMAPLLQRPASCCGRLGKLEGCSPTSHLDARGAFQGCNAKQVPARALYALFSAWGTLSPDIFLAQVCIISVSVQRKSLPDQPMETATSLCLYPTAWRLSLPGEPL